MKREEVKTILPDITDEQLDQLMDLYGTDIEGQKTTITKLQDQLKTARDGLAAFDGVDVQGLQGQIDTLKKEKADLETAHKKDLAERDFSARLDTAIQARKGRSGKAIRAMLDLDTLRASENQEKDINAALDALTKDSAYLFESATPPPYAAGTGTQPLPVTKESFAKMTYQQRLELKHSDPETYKTMKA